MSSISFIINSLWFGHYKVIDIYFTSYFCFLTQYSHLLLFYFNSYFLIKIKLHSERVIVIFFQQFPQ